MPHPREVESSCRRCSAHECPRLTRGEASHGLRASLGGRRPLIQQRSAELRHLRREAPLSRNPVRYHLHGRWRLPQGARAWTAAAAAGSQKMIVVPSQSHGSSSALRSAERSAV
mmetsp:Transcript_34954/g.109723  ORF Transcript_34954/g.109723 Transcript_34954/m.109723 type:complete len:114 (+) Transcript_34954:334-675(+)